MRIVRYVVSGAIVAGLALSVWPAEAQLQKDYPVKPVPFTAVRLTDQFWAPKIETNRTVSIPFAFEQCETTGRVENFLRAAQAIQTFRARAQVLGSCVRAENGESEDKP